VRIRIDPRAWSIARQLFALQVVGIAVVVTAGLVAAYTQARYNGAESARLRVLAVAHSVAAAPTVIAMVSDPGPDPSAVLQPYADIVQRQTGTQFVVIMSTAGIRYTHPNPAEIGRHFIGTIEPALRGESFTETNTGTLGPSERAVVPILDRGGTVRGLVAVGITETVLGRDLRRQVPALLLAALAALLLGGAGAWLASRRLRRQTHDLGPAELTRMYEYYDAVLHAVREGLLLLDRNGRLQLANDEARRLLDLPADAVGRPIGELATAGPLAAALGEGRERVDEIQLTGDRVLVVNQAPARWHGRDLGTVVTLRDHTDLQALTGELDSVRGFAESLRAQAHEAANRLHTVVSLIELDRAEQARDFATAELAVAQRLTDRVVAAVHEPVLAALLLGKAAQASERGIELALADDMSVPEGVADPRDLVTIVGNLIDNAMDAAAAAPPPHRVSVAATAQDGALVLTVVDSGAGLPAGDVERAFTRGWSTKSDGRLIGRGLGLALVGQAVHRCGGTVEVAGGAGALSGAAFTVRVPLLADRAAAR
jgi:sensor histidine kinase regulating citrate/malate metabolism